MPYKKIGLKCGIEIHQQLEGRKLFCSTPTTIRDDKPDYRVIRKMRASAGESGKIDVAAAQEQSRGKTFVYEGYNDTISLVELDEEPPHSMSSDALYTTLQLCKLVKADVSPVVQVMRKTVVDGSNTSGFQRTALVGRKGKIKTSLGLVNIDNISVEEDACRIISDSITEKVYRLDRLGIPLIEIGTAPDIKTPAHCQEVAKQLGMLLRSLPTVKRGLGTIRQDVNVSIKGGVRVEIKGAQDLRQIPLLVDLEIKRQQELLLLKKELGKLNKLSIVDVSLVLSKSSSKVVKSTLKKKGKILGIKLTGFSGLIGRELQPNYRLGTELAGRAKVIAGVSGLFHSDELPNYGITEKEVSLLRKEFKCSKKDAFILVADSEDRAKVALEAIYSRVEELYKGVPKEVRKANSDGTTHYMRPMPGAARMYPETDVPLVYPDTNVELPELLSVKNARFSKDYGLSSDLAAFIVKSTYVDLFEELVKKHKKIKPAFIADVLTSVLVEIRRKYNVDVSSLTEDDFRNFFSYLAADKIHKDITIDVLIDMCKGNFSLKKYESLGTEEIHAILKKIISSNKGAPFPALMGMSMKALAGKASGKFIATELKKML